MITPTQVKHLNDSLNSAETSYYNILSQIETKALTIEELEIGLKITNTALLHTIAVALVIIAKEQ